MPPGRQLLSKRAQVRLAPHLTYLGNRHPDNIISLPGITELDPWLSPFKEAIKRRYVKTQEWTKKIDEMEGGMDKFSRVSIVLCSEAWKMLR